MKQTIYHFFPTIHNFTIDGEKLFYQFLLATFALSFIYFASRSMRIVEKQYKRTSKKVSRLKARMAVVLAQNKPLCHELLFHNVMRCRQSLVAGYIKDLIEEKQLEPEKFSNFFKNVPAISPNKQTFSCSTKSSEKLDSNMKVHTNNVFEKGSPEFDGFDELFGPRKNNTNQSDHSSEENKIKLSKQNEFKAVKSPLESKIFKTMEGPNKRLRSSLIDKRKSKIPKWNMMGCKGAHDRFNENLTVYTALTSTRSPFRVKPYAKSPSQKVRLSLKSSYAKPKPEMLNTNSSTITEEEKQKPKEIEIQETHFEKDTHFENETRVEKETKITEEVTNITEGLSMCSLESSNCECDSDSSSDTSIEQSTQEPFDDGNVRQISPLTTINEESAEENSGSE